MRKQLTKIMQNSILPILLIGGIGVQTITSCSSDNDDDNKGGTSSPSAGTSSSSGGGSAAPCPNAAVGSNTLTCGGQTYRTVNINGQVWMAENLNYAVEGSKCYDNNTANCNKYGRLYNWYAAIEACPTGWHLPDDAEYDALTIYIENNKDCSAKCLKATSGWTGDGNGLDSYGFSALPGGYYNGGNFDDAGVSGYWWSASDNYDAGEYATFFVIYYHHDIVFHGGIGKNELVNVRCLQDAPGGVNNSSSSAGRSSSSSNGGGSLLNGTWIRGDKMTITFIDDKGVFAEIDPSTPYWSKLLTNGVIHIGDRKFKDIEQVSELVWTGQELGTQTNPTSVYWNSGTTITMSADHQTLSVKTSNLTYTSITYTRVSSGGGSSSSGATGSCTVQGDVPVCVESVSKAQCDADAGTFSTAACSASYSYCLSLEGSLPACNLIGGTGMPSKESCPVGEGGIKTFTTETVCGGAKGSCSLPVISEEDGFCVDINKNTCERIYVSFEPTFSSGECGAAKYPCCFFDADAGTRYFNSSFTKSQCYAGGGFPTSANLCSLLSQ